MTSPGDQSALRALLQQVHDARGFRCDAYKETCLRRRVAVRMRACGVHSYAQYARHLDTEPTEYDRLLTALTINVTKFYRNAETWDRLATTFLPELWARRGGTLRCWSAGCASGEEPYTLAVLLCEQARQAGSPAPLDKCIDATDFDLKSLEKARAGRYPAEAFGEMPPPLTGRYFMSDAEHQGVRVVSAGVGSLVRFAQHDLTSDPPPHPPYDLILFRNVVIYFDRPTQERLFVQMVKALAPDGVFVLGKVETLWGAARDTLKLEDIRERIYRRP